MNSFPSDCTCLFEMLDSIYKVTAVLCPLEKCIKILSFCGNGEFIGKKLSPGEFVSVIGNINDFEKKHLLDFICDLFDAVPSKDCVKKCCFKVLEKKGILTTFTFKARFDFTKKKYYLTVEKSAAANETVTFMFKKNAVNVKLSDIIYVDYGNHSVEVHTAGGKMSFFSVRFEDAAKILLENQNFLRSYKNCIVNMDRIISYEKDAFLMENDVHISIPKRRKKDILKAYNDYLLMK